MPRHGDNVELDDLLRRLKKLKEKFPEEGGDRSGARGEDGFNELEDQFLRRYNNAQAMMKQMTVASDTVSVTDTIRQRRNVHNEIAAIGDVIKKMSDLVNKERTRKARGRSSKVSDEELVRREGNMNAFANMLTTLQAEMRKLQGGGEAALLKEAAFASAVPRTTITREQLFSGASVSGPGGHAARSAGVGFDETKDAPLSGEHQQALSEIYRREEEQDQMIDEIGAIIQEAAQIANAINETVTMQRTILEDLSKSIETTQDKLDSTNARLKKSLEERGMSWERMCVVFVCGVLILGLIGVIVNTVLG